LSGSSTTCWPKERPQSRNTVPLQAPCVRHSPDDAGGTPEAPQLRFLPISKNSLRSSSAYKLAKTQPMEGALVVHTTHFKDGIRTNQMLALVAVHTTPGHFRTLDDDQLLLLVSPHTAFLVGAGRGSEQLVFLIASDRGGFLVR
jgi:hypothetical protein